MLADAILFSLFEYKVNQDAIFESPSKGLGADGLALAGEARVDASLPLTGLGLDSLDLVELMVAVEKDFHVELEDAEHESITNIDDIVNKLHSHPRAY